MAEEFRFEGDILLVDSDQTVREETARVLASAGFQVAQATDGNQALKIMERKTWKWIPRFIVIDTLLSGLSSFELVRRLNEKLEKKETLLVMMSKYDAPEDQAEAISAGAVGFILKPVEAAHLKTVYERYQERKLKLEKTTQGFFINHT